VALYRLRYGEALSVEIGPTTADIGIGSTAELDNVISISGEERPVARTIVDELNEDDVFWDVGANVGPFSCIAGDVLEDGRVVAFEPHPPNVERLRHILQRNDAPRERPSRGSDFDALVVRREGINYRFRYLIIHTGVALPNLSLSDGRFIVIEWCCVRLRSSTTSSPGTVIRIPVRS